MKRRSKKILALLLSASIISTATAPAVQAEDVIFLDENGNIFDEPETTENFDSENREGTILDAETNEAKGGLIIEDIAQIPNENNQTEASIQNEIGELSLETDVQTEPGADKETEPLTESETLPETEILDEIEFWDETGILDETEVFPGESETLDESEILDETEYFPESEPLDETEFVETEEETLDMQELATESGDFEYSLSGDNATITKYKGSSTYVSVPSVIDGHTVVSISGTFNGNKELTGVSLPSTLTSIGDSAFKNCEALNSIHIPSGVIRIGDSAFNGCSSITSISLPEGVTDIGNFAFRNCSLTNLLLPESLTTMGSQMIAGTDICQITIPKNVKKCSAILFGAFYGGPMDGALNLTSVVFEDGIAEIPASACQFSSSSYITNVDIPESAAGIGNDAFARCQSLISINIPKNVSVIGQGAFSDCSSLERVTLNYNDQTTNTSGNGTQLFSLVIKDSAFKKCSSLADIDWTENVTSLGNYVFEECTSLTSVTLPDRITQIGNRAFNNCSSLTSLKLPESLTTMGCQMIAGTGICQITVPKNVKKCSAILFGAFYGGPMDGALNLTSVVFEDGIAEIPASVCQFSSSSYITSVDIPESAAGIGNNAFARCQSLTNISIPGTVQRINDSAFSGCSALTKVQILPSKDIFPDAINLNVSEVKDDSTQEHIMDMNWSLGDLKRLTIASGAFTNCTSLKELVFSNNIASIASNAFSGCGNISDIYYPESGENWGKVDGSESSYLANATMHYTASAAGDLPNGCELWIATDKNFLSLQKERVRYDDENSLQTTVTAQKRAKTYYVKVRSYKTMSTEEGTIVKYGTWSEAVTLTVKNPVIARDVKESAEKFYALLEEYLKGVSIETTADQKKYKFDTKTKGQLLREADEASNDRMIVFTNRALTDREKDAIYDTLADYLEEVSEFDLGTIKVTDDKKLNSYSKQIIDAVQNNLLENSREYSKSTTSGIVKFNTIGVSNAFFGNVFLRGNMVGGLLSGKKRTYDTMVSYIKNLSNAVNDLLYQALKSVFQDLGKVTGIAEFIKTDLNEKLDGFADGLLNAGYGNLLKTTIKIQKCATVAEKILSTSSEKDLTKLLEDADKLWKEIDGLDLSDSAIKKAVVKNASSELENQRKDLENTIYAYMTGKEKDEPVSKLAKAIKKLSIFCPVDFEVYNSFGEMIGCVKNGRASYEPYITIDVNGNTKQMWMDSAEYFTIEFIGTGSGEMNYVVQELQGSTVTKQIDYYGIPLQEGTVYKQSVPGGSLAENVSAMTLIAQDNTFSPSDHLDESGNPEYVMISCAATEGGTVSGDQGSIEKGSLVCVKAAPQEGYYFTGWYLEEDLLETSSTYYFCAAKDISLQARFEKKIVYSQEHGGVVGDDYKGQAHLQVIEDTEKTDVEKDQPVIHLDTEQETITFVIKKYVSENEEPVTETKVLPRADSDMYILGYMDMSLYTKIDILDGEGRLIGTFLPKDQIPKEKCEEGSHDYALVEKVEATCKSEGYLLEQCVLCGDELRTTIPATGNHTFGEWMTEKEPTTAEEGIQKRTCNVCGYFETMPIDKLPEKKPCENGIHNYKVITEKAATCGMDGYRIARCSDCGLEETTVLSATGNHTFGKWATEKEPTTAEEGIQKHTCSICGYFETMPIDKLSEKKPCENGTHNYKVITEKAATCGMDGYRIARCSDCGLEETTVLPATGNHQYSDWQTIREATALVQGEQIRTCTVCKLTDTSELAKLTPTIELNVTSIPLKVKQSTNKVKVSGLAKDDYVVSWTSSKPSIVKVTQKGKITARKKTGKAVLTVKLASGKTATVKVTVQKKAVQTKKITGLKAKITLRKGKKQTLKPVLNPITSVQKVTYTSSDKKVATVSAKGVIKAKKAGTTKITVKAGKKKFVVKVTVK